MGKASRDKGKRGERATADEIRLAMPEFAGQIKRGWQARFGSDAPDIVGVPGFWIEVKHGKKPSPRDALAQARLAAEKSGDCPLAVIRDDNKRPFVVLDWDKFLGLMAFAVRMCKLEQARTDNTGHAG